MVELVLSFHYVVDTLMNHINSELYYLKACHSNRTTEERAYKSCDDEQQGWLFNAEIANSNYRWIVLILCVPYVTLATSLSDLSGRRRRPLIFLPIIGKILQSINGLAHWYFWQWSPMSAYITDNIFKLVGGMNMMFVAAQIYICDMSAVENRTMRLGLIWAVRTSCILVGSTIANWLTSTDAFFFSYSLCFVLSIISLMLAALLVKDISVAPAEKQGLLQLCSVMQIVHSFKLVFKETLGSKRMLVLLLLIAYVAVNSTYQGEQATELFFLISRIESLNSAPSAHLGALIIFKNFAVIFGTLFCSLILSKCLRMRDVSVGIFAVVCNILGVMMYFLADQIWHLHIAALINTFHGIVLFASVLFISKFYESYEFGRLFGVLNIFRSVVLFSGWAYGIVFFASSECYPSAVFLNSLFLNFTVLGLYCISFVFWRLVSDPT